MDEVISSLEGQIIIIIIMWFYSNLGPTTWGIMVKLAANTTCRNNVIYVIYIMPGF